MKITLRKMKSSPLGGGYAYDFFTPLQFEHRDAVVSFTVNSHSSQYFNIQRKYAVPRELIDVHEYDVLNELDKNNIKNVTFLNFDSKDIGLVQSNSDVLVLSLKPGASSLAFPSKIPAYMFSSKPILAFVDMPSDISNTIQNANCGWVVQSGDIEGLKNSFSKIFTLKKSELEKMGESGKKYVHAHLSRKANLKRILSIIEIQLK